MAVTSPAQESPVVPGNPVHPNDPVNMQSDKLAMAKQFVMDDATFQFDGMADTVTGSLDESTGTATVEFTSRTAGYGDRSGMMVAEVLTPHKAVIRIADSQVVSAVMDDKWDMLTQKEIA